MFKETPKNGPNLESTPDPTITTSRRKLLALAGSLGLVGAGAGLREVKTEIQKRTENVHEIAKYLRGEAEDTKLKFFGKTMAIGELKKELMQLSSPPLSNSEVEGLLDSFCYMLEVEDLFDKPYNTLPMAENIDRTLEKGLNRRLPLASSFGYGQINPQTAFRLAKSKLSQIKKTWPEVANKINRLGNTPTDFEIQDALELQGNGNIVTSFMAFQEVSNIYGRSTGSVPHGGMVFPDTRGQLHFRRSVDPRAFSLSIAAYSATPISPMCAKAQVYCNEIFMARPDLQAKVGIKGLEVDGSLGTQTLKALQEVSKACGINFPEALQISETSSEQMQNKIQALDTWLASVNGFWKKESLSLFQKELSSAELAELVKNRYSVIMQVRRILYSEAGQNDRSQTQKIKKIFDNYVKYRDPEFLELITNPRKYSALFPTGNYENFLSTVKASAKEKAIAYDERYKGCIPTAYNQGGIFGLADDKNVMRRVTLSHELDLKSTTRIPVDTK